MRPSIPRVRIGTRASRLARWQARLVAQRLDAAAGAASELVVITTDGDLDAETPLPEIGGKGVFTEALERALRAGEIDAAVHSLKDVPVEPAPGLCLAAIGMRAEARDVLIARGRWTLATLPPGSTVGTCSTRRSAQVLAARPDLALAPLRGNVDTRVARALRGDYDAIVIAAAGVIRLGLSDAISELLPLQVMLPAPGQGALAVQCREDDLATRALLSKLDEAPVRSATLAERGFLEGLGGGCSAPVAAYAECDGARVELRGLVVSPEGREVVRVAGAAAAAGARGLGLKLAREAAAAGAMEIIA
jgi:hydroxymethylbilane synthase